MVLHRLSPDVHIFGTDSSLSGAIFSITIDLLSIFHVNKEKILPKFAKYDLDTIGLRA